MSVNTANVETLTAEVRVLMVGSRQVTLSVARQLDYYELLYDDEVLEFTPFGRVRTGRKAEAYTRCDGSARGAEWLPIKHTCPGRKPACGHDQRWINGRYHCGTFERLELREIDFEWVGLHRPTGNLVAVGCFCPNPARVSEDPDLADFAEWFHLPLIVLAGLK